MKIKNVKKSIAGLGVATTILALGAIGYTLSSVGKGFQSVDKMLSNDKLASNSSKD